MRKLNIMLFLLSISLLTACNGDNAERVKKTAGEEVILETKKEVTSSLNNSTVSDEGETYDSEPTLEEVKEYLISNQFYGLFDYKDEKEIPTDGEYYIVYHTSMCKECIEAEPYFEYFSIIHGKSIYAFSMLGKPVEEYEARGLDNTLPTIKKYRDGELVQVYKGFKPDDYYSFFEIQEPPVD